MVIIIKTGLLSYQLIVKDALKNVENHVWYDTRGLRLFSVAVAKYLNSFFLNTILYLRKSIVINKNSKLATVKFKNV